jgi:hypothetical protein
MSDKPHANAVRSPFGFWLMLEADVPDGWETRWGPGYPWEPWEPGDNARWNWWTEARPVRAS